MASSKVYPGISSPDKMSTAKEELVWVGFIDVLPVIGSVKEAVEFVLAVAGGDPLLTKEKERMMMVRLGLEQKTQSGRSSGSSSGYVSGEEREAIYVEGVPVGNLLTFIKDSKANKGKQAAKPPPAKDKNKMAKIKSETEEKIKLMKPNYSINEPLTDTGGRSERGEHVINNNVIKFHFNLIVKNYLRKTLSGAGHTKLDVSCPLQEESQRAIMYGMVAHFGKDELYINANAVVYGEYSSALRDALLQFLQDGSQKSKDRVRFIIHNMNDCDAYVDSLAKEKWIGNCHKKLHTFQTIREEVAEMFAEKRGIEFFETLRNDILRILRNV